MNVTKKPGKNIRKKNKIINMGTQKANKKINKSNKYNNTKINLKEADIECLENSLGETGQARFQDMDGGSGFVCNQCDYVGNCFNSLKFHQKVKHGVKCWFCPTCNLPLNSLVELRQHQMYEHNLSQTRPEYSCSQCNFVTYMARSLYAHIDGVHHVHPCDLCNYEAENLVILKYHKDTRHKAVGNVSCNLCKFQCMKETELTSHILRRHPQGPQDSIFYPCDKCEFQSMTKNALKVHTQSKHSRSRVWSNRCTDCGYAAKSQKLLSRHVAIAPNEVKK